jgi:ribosomal protein S5
MIHNNNNLIFRQSKDTKTSRRIRQTPFSSAEDAALMFISLSSFPSSPGDGIIAPPATRGILGTHGTHGILGTLGVAQAVGAVKAAAAGAAGKVSFFQK